LVDRRGGVEDVVIVSECCIISSKLERDEVEVEAVDEEVEKESLSRCKRLLRMRWAEAKAVETVASVEESMMRVGGGQRRQLTMVYVIK
jgi:hypothetical protein